MDAVSQFGEVLAQSERLLAVDEWALYSARRSIVAQLEPHECFESVVPALRMGLAQIDEGSLAECCWLALELAAKSGTTEIPLGLHDALSELNELGGQFGPLTMGEVAKVAKWFRLSDAI